KLYKQYVRPVLEYGSVVTSLASRTSVGRLQVVQNAALRVALRARRRTRIADLHSRSNVETIDDRLMKLRQKAVQRFGDSQSIKSLEFQQSIMSKGSNNLVVGPAAEGHRV